MSLGNDTGTTMLVQPSYGNGGGFGNMFGGDGWWIIILFLIFGMFGGGCGNGFGGGMNGGVGSEVQRGFDHSATIQKLDGITQGLCDGFYAVNNALGSGFNATQMAIMQGNNALQAQLADCCCTTQRAIDGVNYNLATQSCDTRNLIQNVSRDIIDNANANSRAILDFLTQDKIAALTAENQSLKYQATISQQNALNDARSNAAVAEILRRTGNDCPSAAYIVNPPTPVNFPVNTCGNAYGYNGAYNNGCGCGI